MSENRPDFGPFLKDRLAEKEQYARDLVTHGPRDVSGLLSLSQQMLAEVKAAREIIAEWEDSHGGGPDFDGGWSEGLEHAIRCMAGVYRDHPGYPGRLADRWAPLRGSGPCPACGVPPGALHRPHFGGYLGGA